MLEIHAFMVHFIFYECGIIIKIILLPIEIPEINRKLPQIMTQEIAIPKGKLFSVKTELHNRIFNFN
jgi:hypothetical protein